jgi:hypothetical protein
VVLCAWCEGRCLTKYCYLLHLVGLDFITNSSVIDTLVEKTKQWFLDKLIVKT